MLLKCIHIARYYFFLCVFYLLEKTVPKSSSLWCFATWDTYPHTMDNVRAVFEAVKDDPKIVKIVLRRAKQDMPSIIEGRNVKFVHEASLAGAYYLARCKVFLIGTALAGFTHYHKLLGDKHTIIQLWHGIPLKRIGKLFPPETHWQAETGKYSATICSSSIDKQIMQQVFSPVKPVCVWQTGLPRNDFILGAEKLLPGDYQQELESLRVKLQGRNLVLYAPTWRDNSDNIYCFSILEIAAIEKLMKRFNAVFAVRGHSNVRGKSILKSISNNILAVNDIPDVNLILRKTDVLITDYSSIYIDFLITERPIIYFTYDKDSYVNERGFLYDLGDAFVAEPAVNFDQLLQHVELALASGVVDKPRYQKVKSLFHQHDYDCGREVVENIKRLG